MSHKKTDFQKILVLTLLSVLTMTAFAANSILGRAALRPTEENQKLIDPASYTLIRIATGAMVLFAIQLWRKKATFDQPLRLGSLLSPLMLVVYALGFSFAYVSLDAASGTLILFTFVQLSMVTIGVFRGERSNGVEFCGLGLASAGLIYLLIPNLRTPELVQSLLMAVAGIGWGCYSYLGKSSKDPITNTTFNFALGFPLIFLATLWVPYDIDMTNKGILLAALSGGLASGLGYVLWYTILPSLRSTQAAAMQLSVPILAAVGGKLFVGDELTFRTVIAGITILSGIGLTIPRRQKTQLAQDQIPED